MYKAIGHCRVSKGDETEIQNSLKSQQSEIRVLANRLGLKEEEIDWFIEKEARSSFQDRANWTPFENKIDEACKNPNICYFLAYSQERFCRNCRRSRYYKSQLRRRGIEIRFVSGDVVDPDSDSGYWQDNIQEIAAEGFSRKISADTLRGCKENAITRDVNTGYAYKNGGTAPFWLKSKKITIGEDRYGEPIKKTIWIENDNIFSAKLNGKLVSKTMWEWARYYFLELRLNQKLGIDKARDVLNELEIPAPRGKQWATTCLYSAEKSEALIGIGIYNKRQFGKNAGGRIKDKDEWIIVENAHPALLTQDEFKALEILRQSKLKREGTESRFQSNNKHLLIGYPEKFTCACCGHKIITSGNVYTCGKYNTNGKKGCGASYFSVNCEWLESKVLHEILNLFTEEQIEKAYFDFVKLYQKDNNRDKEIKNLKKQIDRKTVAQNCLINAIAGMGLHNEFAIKSITNQLNKISQDLETLNDGYAKLNANSSIVKIPSYKTFKHTLLQTKMLLTRSNTAENKEIIWEFVNSITLDPTTREVNVEFNTMPFGMIFNKIKKFKTKKEGAFAPSMKMVAGAGFEPTTFGL